MPVAIVGGLFALGTSYAGYRSGLKIARESALRSQEASANAQVTQARTAVRNSLNVLWAPPDALTVHARTAIARILHGIRLATPITYTRRTAFYNTAYALHAPIGWAMICVGRYRDQVASLLTDERNLATLWHLTSLLPELFIDDALASDADEQFLDTAPLLRVMLAPPDGPEKLVSRGALLQRVQRDRLNEELKPTREALAALTLNKPSDIFRRLIAYYLVCDLIERFASGQVPKLANFPFTPEDRDRLAWGSAEVEAFVSARDYVEQAGVL